MKNIYMVDDLEFHSIKDMSKHSGVHAKTITKRLQKGMSPQEACQKTDLRCRYMPYENEEKSISQICDEREKDETLVRNRLKYGYSLKDALDTPKKITRQGKPIEVYGISYNSVSEACRKRKLEDKEGTIRSRLRAGKTPEEAFSF